MAEAVVEAALHGEHGGLLQHRLRFQFRRAADRIYQDTDGRDREAAFGALYSAMFAQLDHERTLQRSFREFPVLRERVDELVVACARRAAEEGTDLPAREPDAETPRRAILRIQPARFLEADGLRAFLRFNWLQLGDLSDSAFGYEGDGVRPEMSPAEVRLFVEAYGLVWAVYTEARMRRRHWPLPPDWPDLAGTLHQLAGPAGVQTVQSVLERVRGRAPLTHPDLMELTTRIRFAARHGHARAIEVCALCRFASADIRPSEDTPEAARRVLMREYPDVVGGVCGHCVERLELLDVSGAAVEPVAMD